MKFIKGQDRTQTHLFPVTLDQSIDPENEVRLIDLFVDSLPLENFGFAKKFVETGRPAYHPSDLLKLYIYGYLNKVRSSRDLEKECKRNIEVMWLLKALQPDHNTISNFRRDNPNAIKKVFRETVRLAKHFDLIGGKLVAGDSTKFRAQNSKKNNFNKKKIERHVDYIDTKIEEYNRLLAKGDGDNKDQLKKEIEKHQQRKNKYKELDKQLNESGEVQVSTSDPDSRQMIIRNNITEVAYNVQTTVDAKNNIPIDYKVTNTNDSKAMGSMLKRAKSILQTNEFTALYDKGYHTGSEFQIADKLGIEVMVAIPTVAAQAPNPAYNVEHFIYNKEADFYICPEGNHLHTTGSWHKTRTYNFKRYTTRDCLKCTVKAQCSKAKYGKGIQRSEYQELINNNKASIENNKNYYRRRQAIVEHPYGTIKRQWGFSYIMTKRGKQNASADVGLMFTAYNLRRIFNILDKNVLTRYLEWFVFIFYGIFHQIRLHLVSFKASKFQSQLNILFNNVPLNFIIFNQNLIKTVGF
jgi:transposase